MAETALTIGHLAIGEQAVVADIDSAHGLRLRLMEMGFTEGSPVKIVRKAIFGDPIQVQIRNSRFAIRKADAKLIRINKVS